MGKISRSLALAHLEELRAGLGDLVDAHPDDPMVNQWCQRADILLNGIFGKDSDHLKGLREVSWAYGGAQSVSEADSLLTGCKIEVEAFWPPDGKPDSDPMRAVTRICEQFHRVAMRLKARGRSRAPLLIDDEYDIHYVLEGLLASEFDDITPEAWTPAYLGGGSRIDLLLGAERIAIEAKFVRANLLDREVADELAIDVARYAAHVGVDTLFCFVYDPASRLVNPAGLERDLSQLGGRLKVVGIVRPR